MPVKPEIFALVLGIFFIIAAVIKGIAGSLHRRKMANIKAAQASGGTEESPVQLFNPFNEHQEPKPAEQAAQKQEAPKADPQKQEAAPKPLEPASATNPRPKSKLANYAWE